MATNKKPGCAKEAKPGDPTSLAAFFGVMEKPVRPQAGANRR
jgi:hypothetical protein